jgi:hypothetical protein
MSQQEKWPALAVTWPLSLYQARSPLAKPKARLPVDLGSARWLVTLVENHSAISHTSNFGPHRYEIANLSIEAAFFVNTMRTSD